MNSDKAFSDYEEAAQKRYEKEMLKGGVRTPITCSHCGGYLIIIDDAVSTTMCESCGCRWEMRQVPVSFGPGCQVRPEVYPQPDQEPESAEERLRGI